MLRTGIRCNLEGKKSKKHIKKVMVNLLAAIAVKCRTVED